MALIEAITMPKLGLSMTEGRIAAWNVTEGARVEVGQVIADIETSKIATAFESPSSGVIRRRVASEQVDLPVGALIAVVADESVAESSIDQFIGNFVPGDFKDEEHGDADGGGAASDDSRPIVAEAIAQEDGGSAFTELPLSSMRKAIAQRLTEAKRNIPHYYLTVDCDVDELLALRAQLNARFGENLVTINDMVIRAAALALKKVPAANASFTETAIRIYSDVDISVAVATPSGLITPIIRGADCKAVETISREMRKLIIRAREGSLKFEEYQGGGFTISNLGMYGIRQFAAIINPPQGCILAVGAAERRAVIRGEGVTVAKVMTCTLSVDHRVVDGAVGAEFLAVFKMLIEEPQILGM